MLIGWMLMRSFILFPVGEHSKPKKLNLTRSDAKQPDMAAFLRLGYSNEIIFALNL